MERVLIVWKEFNLLNNVVSINKFIITNPPYLHINKAQNKEIFELYKTDDLYKASLLSIMKTADKGIIILPSAF
jgi:tRNA1(Val) A37 N6-methylase TrmN6